MTTKQPSPTLIQTLHRLAHAAQWERLLNTPPAAPFGRCSYCQRPLDRDGDCIECLRAIVEMNLAGYEVLP